MLENLTSHYNKDVASNEQLGSVVKDLPFSFY